MSEYFGPGVSRTLSAYARQFSNVVFQSKKPPLDSEINLLGQVVDETLSTTIRSQMHSGFLVDPTKTLADYVTESDWSNFFVLGRQASGEDAPILWANVNGWVLPVTGTSVPDGDTTNQINLNPPPDSDARIDLVFLEVWQALVAPNPSTDNKPSASTIWAYGNVEFGGTDIPDDLEDPAIGYVTTLRVQTQYRLRVFGSGAGLGSSVALDVYPDGLGDPNVLGQGVATNPVSGFPFVNMREALGDPSLWRAGDGDPFNNLGTVDGYVYAIPVAAIFRRNSSPFAAIELAGAANQNGALNRNPSASTLPNPRSGAKVFTTPVLTLDISANVTGVITVTNLTDSGFDDPDIDLASTFIVVDDEVIGPLTAVNSSTITIGSTARGRNGTMAVPHVAGATVRFFNPRPDGLFADQIANTDILDLRRGVTAGDWDYQSILIHNLSKLVQGTLRTSYKQASAGDTEGVQVVDVSYMLADGGTAVPISTTAVDGTDGIRTVFSDAAAFQSGVTVLCDNPVAAGPVAAFDTGISWDVGADFKPSGFATAAGFANGSVIYLNIGGADGNSGARGTFRDSGTNAVRFVSPMEYWKTDIVDSSTGLQAPLQIRFLGEGDLEPAAPSESAHPGPMYPTRATSFETPFIVLGGILNSVCNVPGVVLDNDSPASGEYEIQLPGLDFNAAGAWYPVGDVESLDPSNITFPVLRGQRTLFDMLTQGGSDLTGESSEVYLVLSGDSTHAANNGAFQVIGAGTVGYTAANASAADRVRVRFLSVGVSQFTLPSSGVLTAELRSQYTNAEDGAGGSASPPASLAIVWTDIEGATSGSPWSGSLTSPVTAKMVISSTLQYHPGRGATAKVADNIWRVAGVSLGVEYLRQAPGSLDTTFPSAAGVPSDETYFDINHVQTWNRLPSLGLDAPFAPNYGGGIAAYSEQTREAECLVDRGSKTLIFRPFLDRAMTLQARTSTAGSGLTLLGSSTYPGPTPPYATPKDGAGIWTTGLHMGFNVPPEFMPRFGRQDIPYHNSDGSGTFLPGINHLFTDSNDVTEAQSYIIGGQDSTNATIRPMFIQTGVTGLDYGEYGTITGPGTQAYQGQLINLPQVISSDLGRGMQGIQLPPFLGVARLYGVYDRRDYLAKGGSTFNSNRVTPAADPATNLLRTDATKQTLFILEGGGFAATGDMDDHTYIIPSNALDISLSPEFVDGEVFEDLEYVVEFCCFGFAKGFINKNNYVLCRRHKGSATLIVDGSNPEAAGARMTIPAPAPQDALYVGASRTPYQGDPYMTRAGTSRTVTDYASRYGQIPIASQYLLRTSIQQYTSAGVLIPQTPNRRSLEVLAALDFYTTLGTGKVGGQLYAGTPLDVGYTQDTVEASSRLPSASLAPAWRVLTRSFTEGQRDNASHASLVLRIVTNTGLSGKSVTFSIPGQNDITLTAGVDFVVAGSATASATNLGTAIEAHPILGSFFQASANGTTTVPVIALMPGSAGNQIRITTSSVASISLNVPQTSTTLRNLTSSYMVGGVDLNVNAGNGTSQLDLTGMTERLPLGILLQDSDFLCENPLGDNASALATQPPGIQPVQSLLPLAGEFQEYTRFLGGPGQWLGMADGGILQYEAYDATTAPSGTQKFRLFRGGGSAFVLTDPVPGGPIDWVSGSYPESLKPVLKGGVLICKALLVRNLPESAFSPSHVPTEGDEIQMVILTYGHLGRGETGILLSGIISPTGYGEGYAAADRYRIEGRPMIVGRARVLATADAEPAVYPGNGAEPLE